MTPPDASIEDSDELVPGDVVVDDVSHRVMQVVGRSHKRAENVDAVWNSAVNHHRYDIQPDADLIELVALPTGETYYIPREVVIYPVDRVTRVMPEPATRATRPQLTVARAVLAELVADADDAGYPELANSIVKLVETRYSRDLADDVSEFASLRSAERDGGDE